MFKMFRTFFLIVFLALALKLLVGEEAPRAGLPASSKELTSSSSPALAGVAVVTSVATDEPAAAVAPPRSDLVADESSELVPAELPTKLYVTGSKVNLRDGPSINGKALGQLAEGTVVERVSQVDGWIQIQTPLGQGWMATRFLSPEKPSVVSQTEPSRAVAAPSSVEVSRAKAEIIRQSIASYAGSCPCPYNSDRAGRRCGGRSAWSRPGGYSPICYESDISEERLQTYFARVRGAAD